MSENAKDLIVNLLNRNPARRLGASQDGAEVIKKLPFFKGINWDTVLNRGYKVPKPSKTIDLYREHFDNVVCPKHERKRIFED